MKKFAALALFSALAATASAQSSVTVFGIVDASVRNVKNGSNDVFSLASGGANSSRLGFRGTEDLGGGLRASFWLEHGFNVDTGTLTDASRFWNRRATVGLSSTTLGEIRAGREYTPTYLAWADFDPFNDNGIARGGKFSTSLFTATDTNTRADNMVSYLTPDGLGGFYGQLSVAAGEGTTVGGKKYLGGRVGYRAGALNANVGYSETEIKPEVAAGSDRFKDLIAGASYDFGVAKLSGYFDKKKYAKLITYTYNVGVAVPVGPGFIRAGYTKQDAQGALPNVATTSFNDADQFALGYVYNLSKRTSLYGTVARINNDGRATYVTNTEALPAAVPGGKSTGYEFGIRHAF